MPGFGMSKKSSESDSGGSGLTARPARLSGILEGRVIVSDDILFADYSELWKVARRLVDSEEGDV
jgi:hypothetical protein